MDYITYETFNRVNLNNQYGLEFYGYSTGWTQLLINRIIILRLKPQHI